MPISKPPRAIKYALQSRSRHTYQAILDATAHILKHSPQLLNTNKIATTAGVSIGSLYQYFPNKLAIVAELIDQEFKLDLKIFSDMQSKSMGQSLQIIMQNFLYTISKITKREFELKRALNVKLLETDKIQQASKLQMDLIALFSELLQSAPDWPKKKDPNLVAYLLFSISAHTYWSSNEYGEIKHQQIKKELLKMFAYYFQ